jgi:rRNA maturation protein Nop10
MPPIGTKNLGLIKAIHVGINPPLNTKIIWYYDGTTPYATGPAKVHYYYDVITSQWLPLGGGGSGGGSFISIPTPIIKTGALNETTLMESINAYYLPTADGGEDFLLHKPAYFLFVSKYSKQRIKRNKTGYYKSRKAAGFVHPVHNFGENFPSGAFYSGSNVYPVSSEFGFNAGPYVKSPIALNPFDWIMYDQSTTPGVTDWIQANATHFVYPSLREFRRFRWRQKKQAKTMLFSLAIGIVNPDSNSKTPIIFGELSKPFKIRMHHHNGTIEGLNVSIEFHTVRRQKPY